MNRLWRKREKEGNREDFRNSSTTPRRSFAQVFGRNQEKCCTMRTKVRSSSGSVDLSFSIFSTEYITVE